MKKPRFEAHPSAFWYMNMLIPALFGILLYTFIRQDGLLSHMEYFSTSFRWLRSVTYHEYTPSSWFGLFVKNQLGDLLWAYALEVALVLSMGNLKKATTWGIIIAITTECCQLLPFIYATFDVLDIIAQVGGVVLASIVSKTFYKHWLTIETH